MKRNVLLAAMLLSAGSLMAADLKDDVTAAAAKLAAADNYSWHQTTENAGGGGGGGGRGFGGGPMDGQATKDGWTYTKMSFGDNTFETAYKGTNGAMDRGEGWQTFAEMAAANGGGGGGRRGGGFGRTNPAPASQIADLLKQVGDLKESGGAIVGDLTEEGAKARMSFGGGRRGGGNGPTIEGAKGSVKFWIKDGMLVKYTLNVQGKMTIGDNDPMDVNRTTTVEIKDIGNTKISIPEDVKKKLS